MNPDPDYSAAYAILQTDTPGLEGHGVDLHHRTRQRDLLPLPYDALAHNVVGLELDWIR